MTIAFSLPKPLGVDQTISSKRYRYDDQLAPSPQFVRSFESGPDQDLQASRYPNTPARVMFLYLGRRGSIPRLTLELAKCLQAMPDVDASICISRQNELFPLFKGLGINLFPVDTFQHGRGALLESWRVPYLRNQIFRKLRQDRVQAVIELMPHVWSPLIAGSVHAAGCRYVTTIHDANAHVGDPTGWVKPLLDLSIKAADRVITLSDSVAEKLINSSVTTPEKLARLFHPDIAYENSRPRFAPSAGEPLKLLFLGRILPYKGLDLFIDTADELRAQGIKVQLGVYGEGALGASQNRLSKLNATVVNRWLSEAEISEAISSHHAVVLSHTEASQSGVAAVALGSGLPVIATPVGGLVEQIIDGETGVLSEEVSAGSLAQATKRLLLNAPLYEHVCQQIRVRKCDRSTDRFLRDCVYHALAPSPSKPMEQSYSENSIARPAV